MYSNNFRSLPTPIPQALVCPHAPSCAYVTPYAVPVYAYADDSAHANASAWFHACAHAHAHVPCPMPVSMQMPMQFQISAFTYHIVTYYLSHFGGSYYISLITYIIFVVAHYLLVNNYSANAYAYHPVYAYANASALCICPCLCLCPCLILSTPMPMPMLFIQMVRSAVCWRWSNAFC